MHITWDDVFSKPIREFLNVLAYTRDKAQIDKEREKEYLKKMKH
jgi:hypothetical protein